MKGKCKKKCNSARETGNLARYVEVMAEEGRRGRGRIKEDKAAG
jgi:hypothetical protein